MTAPQPCDCHAWARIDDIPASAVGMHSPAEWCAFLELATDILWAATGRRWRGRTSTAEVVLRAAPPRPGEGSYPYHRSWGACGCFAGWSEYGYPLWRDFTGPFRHEAPASIRLPHSDVTRILSVEIDGEPLTAWRLDGAWLTRTDGCPWPVCHDRAVVRYEHGLQPPRGARLACVELAVEFGRAASDDPDRPCRLPQRVQSVTRQGITYETLDDMEFLSQGLTGLYTVDAWIRSVNPYGRPVEASVWSPDLPRARRI